MSIDLSHPSIAAIRTAIEDKSDPTCWFVLHYSPTPTVSVLASGTAPAITCLLDVLEQESTNEDVLFCYAEIGEKGLVLVYLKDSVGGVRRARAVVHSRAIASLFPDYSALVTIAHPSQLTEELVNERLGLNHPPVMTMPPQREQSSATAAAAAAATATAKPNVHGQTQVPSPTHHVYPQAGPAHAENGNQSFDTSDQHQIQSTPSTSTPLQQRDITNTNTSTPPPPASPTQKYQFQNHNQGISSADYFKDDSSRIRKTSLTTRLKNTFQRSSSEEPQSQPQSPAPAPATSQPSPSAGPAPTPTPGSPASPSSTSTRFKSSSLAKAFHRRRSSGNTNTNTNANGIAIGDSTPPTSPKIDEFGRGGYGGIGGIGAEDQSAPPPVPPKDHSWAPPHPSYIPTIVETSAAPSQTTLGHGSPHGSGSGSGNEDRTSSSQPQPQNQSTKSALSPSPSARQALFDARQKSLTHETAIQERFRRDQEERARHRTNGHDHDHDHGSDDDDDKSIRLAYDESDEEDQDIVSPPSNVAIKSPVELQSYTTTSMTNHGVSPASPLLLEVNGHTAPQEDVSAGEIVEEDQRAEGERVAQTQAQTAKEDEERMERNRREIQQSRLEAEAEQRAKREADERIAAEQTRKKAEEQERLRLQEEERAREEEAELARERQKMEEERQRRADEEERMRSEAEERMRLEAEATAIAAEKEKIRLERLRAQEEAERILREEQLEEERKLREEQLERERLQQEQQEKERRKVEEKAAVRERLSREKQQGGIMLRGWVTAQTFKSMTWRRRYFHLQASEMQLFKTEGDIKPIQIIYFGPGSSISTTYEESQVKDSFKIISDGPKGQEEFFLFTDSAEDKEVVIEGIRLCLS